MDWGQQRPKPWDGTTRELLGIASGAAPGERRETRVTASLSTDGIAFSLIDGYRRTGDRHIADAILVCVRAKIEGDGVQRAVLERAQFQFIGADDDSGESVRPRRR